MTAVPGWEKTFIPLYIHGDGVEFQQRDSLMTYSWGSLLSEGASQDSTMLLACWPKSCTKKGSGSEDGTWKPILQVLHWSFQALFQGKHPELDHNGLAFDETNPLSKLAGQLLCPAGLRCCIWSLQGDHEYFANTLRLPHWASHRMCWSCNCDDSCPELTWRNLMPYQQKWVPKNLDQAKATLQSDHPFFQLAGVTTMNVCQDALHILFCKGVCAHLLGSVLHTMAWPSKGRQTTKPADRLAAVFTRVQEIYKETRPSSRLTNLKLAMFTDESKPHSQYAFLGTKGAETKHLAKPLAIVCGEMVDATDEFSKRRAACVAEMVSLIDQIDLAGTFLTSAEAQTLEATLIKFFGHYCWLNKWAETEGRLLFHIVPKFHMLHHMVLDAKFLNPSKVWCFKGEDYVGKISTLAGSVTMSVRSTKLSQKVASKYRHWLHLRLTRGDFD